LATDRVKRYGAGHSVVTKDFRFALDNGCLAITLKGEDAPRLLTAGETHSLFNLLFVNKQDILDANVEARSYGIDRRKWK
jgi:hypothetical protein